MNVLTEEPATSALSLAEPQATPSSSFAEPLPQALPEELERRVRNSLYHCQVKAVELLKIKHLGGGVMRIRGRVQSRHAKWLIVNCCQRVAGVHRLVDQLRVGRTTPHRARRKMRSN